MTLTYKILSGLYLGNHKELYLELYIIDTALKVSRSCTVSLLLYLMVLKTISPGCGVQASTMQFLCQLTCQSADIMSSLCGVVVRVRVNNLFSKTTRPRDMLFFLKDTLSIEDENLFKACKSVCSSVC